MTCIITNAVNSNAARNFVAERKSESEKAHEKLTGERNVVLHILLVGATVVELSCGVRQLGNNAYEIPQRSIFREHENQVRALMASRCVGN